MPIYKLTQYLARLPIRAQFALHLAQARKGQPIAPQKMFSLLFAFLFKFALPLLVLVAIVDALSQTKQQRIRRLSKSGQSQRSIAERLGVTRYQVRLALA